MEGLLMEDALHHLKPIIIQRKRYTQQDRSLYRVYAAPGQYELIEAATAHEAFEKSGIHRPHKIERETLLQHTALTPEHIAASDEEPLAFDTRLPDAAEMAPTVFAALLESSQKDTVIAFEDLSLAQLSRKEEPPPCKETAPPCEIPSSDEAAQELSPAPQAAAEPAPAANPSPTEHVSTTALTADEVDALLNEEQP